MSAAKQTGGQASASVEEIRDDIAETREDLSRTAAALAEKADVKARTRKAARRTAAKARDQAQETSEEVAESVRRRPGRWAALGAGVIVGATAAAIGVLRWRRVRNTPTRRAQRGWRRIADRFNR